MLTYSGSSSFMIQNYVGPFLRFSYPIIHGIFGVEGLCIVACLDIPPPGCGISGRRV